MDTDRNAPPLNPLPWVVWAIVLPMIALEVVVAAGQSGYVGGPMAVGWRSEAVQMLAFSPQMMRAMVEAQQYPLDGMWRLVSYPFVHVSTGHALFVVVVTLALGKFVGEAFAWWAVLVVFFLAAVAGAAAMTLIPWVQQSLVGGWVPIYGLVGAMSNVLWFRLRNDGSKRWRAFSLIGGLMFVKIVFGTLFGIGQDWVAELPAFASGFLVSYLVAPGGIGRLRSLIRAR